MNGTIVQAEVIYPTHRCFDDCVDYLNDLAAKEPAKVLDINKEYRIVHAICLFPNKNERYSHAWLEYRNSAIFGAIYKGERVFVRVPRKEYYAKLQPQKVVKYTLRQCLKLEKYVFGYCGPWDPEIRSLCPDQQIRGNEKWGKIRSGKL